MALSIQVKEELQALQLYYKSLYFFRWLLPTALKNSLDQLEAVDWDSGQHYTYTVMPYLLQLCNFFIAPKWYARLLLSLLPGLRTFSTSQLMQEARRLHEYGLLSHTNLKIIIQYEPLQEGVLGLLALKLNRADNIDPLSKEHKVIQIVKVRQCKLSDDLTLLFYEAIAQRADLPDFATPIAYMQTDLLDAPFLLKHLLTSPTPMQYAEALKILNEKSLLSTNQEPISGDSIDPEVRFNQLKAEILNVIVPARRPVSLACAVVNLKQHHILDKLTFDALKTSEAPTDLAELMVQFGSRLDQQIVPQLETHRKNRDLIARVHHQPSEDRTLDVTYSTDLAGWIAQQTHPCSQLAFALYDHYYPAVSETSPNNLLLGVLSQINQQRLFEGELKHGYYAFLTNLSSIDALETYASVLLILNAVPDLVTVNSQTELLALVKSCGNPKALLAKMRPAEHRSQPNITQGFLRNAVLTINRDITRAQNSALKIAPSSKSSSVVQPRSQAVSTIQSDFDVEATGCITTPTGNNEDVESAASGTAEAQLKPTRVSPFARSNGTVTNPASAIGALWGTVVQTAKNVAGAVGEMVASSSDEDETNDAEQNTGCEV